MSSKLASVILLCLVQLSVAAQYYVRTDGADTNDGLANVADTAGTSGQAWLTIQKAANTLTAGDTVTVAAGTYPEYVATVNAGTLGNRITYTASGTVYCYGFHIQDGYVTISGFTVRHNSRANRNEAFVYLGQNSDNAIVENCTFGPGMYLKRTDYTFADTNPDTITTATGGFTAAGFRSGATIGVSDSESGTDTENDGFTYLVASVTDTTLTLDAAATVVAETSRKGYLFGATKGVNFYSTTTNCIVRNNTFASLGAEAIQMGGSGHLVENNTFTNTMGWDVLLYGGSNSTIRRNVIKDSTALEIYDPSPDALSNYGTAVDILIEENMVLDFAGALGFDHGNTVGPVTWRKNVFANVGHGYQIATNAATFDRNVFYLVGTNSSTVVAAQNHPIEYLDTSYNPTTATIKDNIFLGCGYQQTNARGWYIDSEPSMTFTTDYNYVSGPAASYATKTGFSETHGINGGNPLFVNVSSPLGVDGLPFTADDGFQLSAGSPAIGAGTAGADIGAYDYEVAASASVEVQNLNVTNLIIE